MTNIRANRKLFIYKYFRTGIIHVRNMLMIGLIAFIVNKASGQIVITEWMYSGANGEFVEFTNIGSSPIDMTGWSYDDKSEMPGAVDLSGFGIVDSGESVILTEAAATDFEAAWGISGIKIIGGVDTGLGRNDQINLFDSSGTKVDQLSYGDEDNPGTPRTQYVSCSIPAADYSETTAQMNWVLSSKGDMFGAKVSAGGDIASPGRVVGYALSDYDMDGDVGLSDLITFISCFTGVGISYDPLPDGCELSLDEYGLVPVDADKDYDIDLYDFGVFASCYSGEGNPAEPLCGCSFEMPIATNIIFNGDTITVDGTGVIVEGTIATINMPGAYTISGTLNDGQLAVNSPDTGLVEVILNGVNMSSSTSAPINVIDASFTSIVLADGSENYLADAAEYVYPDSSQDEPSGCVFSDDSMAISGTGTLTVYGNYNDAIVSKDQLVIYDGIININSVDDGIRGKDKLLIKNGTININAEGDGLVADNEDDPNWGCIKIENGLLNITSGGDGMAAETDITIKSGDINIFSGGMYTAYLPDDVSAKGIKAGVGIKIDGGTFELDCADDAIHSNETIEINDGTFEIATGDDGIHADSAIDINGGMITVSNCYEGIEAAVITINDGDIHINSSDDGINVAGGNDSSGGTDPWHRPGGGPGGPGDPGEPGDTGDYFLYINGGHIVVNASGDGLDANGSIEINGGTIIVNGPTADNNNAVDFDGSCNMNGGFMVAVGSSQMAQSLSTTSTQRSVKITYSSWKTANTLIHIETTSGEDILTFAPGKAYKSCVFSSPELVSGTSYRLYSGGSCTGINTDGLYEGGIYSPGTLTSTFTASSIATNVSSQ